MSGSQLGRFRLEEKLGAGGMGEVYRATDTRLGRTVAIKVLPATLTNQPDRLARFEQEARAASALNHPNIITVYDAGSDSGVPWIAMEYVHGQTLRQLLRSGPVQAEQLGAIASQIAAALAAAHEAGIIHRDLKPENVIFNGKGLVKILDFGLAKLNAKAPAGDDETQLLTNCGDIFGTPGYIAPEQLRGEPGDHRADQFAFGVMLYELAVGSNPFKRDTFPQTTAATLEAEPSLNELSKRGAPESVTTVIARCLSKKPSGRYASTSDLLADLQGTKPAKRKRTWRRGFLIATAAFCIAGYFSGEWIYSKLKPSSTRSTPVVAVRSFKNLSGDPAQEYLSAGLAEELHGQLSKISSIRLLGRSSVDRYAGSDLRQMAKELGANCIVEGSVRVSSGNLRLSVQLIDPTSEQTLWSEQFDRQVEDILTVQSQVARQVTQAMQAALTPEERNRIGKRTTESAAAYELYLQATKLGGARPELAARKVSLLRQAIEIDPNFTDAMAQLSHHLATQSQTATTGEALALAERVLALDPNHARALHSVSAVYAQRGYFGKARLTLLRALEADPNRTALMADLATMLQSTGNLEEALHWARTALERDPLYPGAYLSVLGALVQIGRPDAIDNWQRVYADRYPNNIFQRTGQIGVTLLRGGPKLALQQAHDVYRATNHPIALSMLSEVALAADAPDAEELYRKLHGDALEGGFIQWWYFPESPRVHHAYFALRRGDKAAAARLLRDAETSAMEKWRQGVDTSFLPVEIAAIHALRSDQSAAVSWLERAYDRGYREDLSLRLNPKLRNLRSHPSFLKLLEKIKDEKARIARESPEFQELFEKVVPNLPPPPKRIYP